VKVVSNVAVTISCSNCRLSGLKHLHKEKPEAAWNSSGGDPGWGGGDATAWGPQHPTTEFPQYLDYLFGFKLGTKITIRMWHAGVIKSSLIDHQCDLCAVVTPIITPTLERLCEAGYQTKIILSQHGFNASPEQFF
jgi:hypothetical protein